MLSKWISLVVYMACFTDMAHGITCSSLTINGTTQYIDSHAQYGSTLYSNNYEACWILVTQDSSKIVGLTTIDFDVEKSNSCGQDKLDIYNSNTQTSSGKFAYFCGDKIGEDIFTTLYSSDRNMYLLFQTNSNTQKDGFRFSAKQYDKSKYDPDLWKSTYFKYGLNGGEIAGIIVGSLFIITIGYCWIRDCQRKKAAKAKANNQAQARPNQTRPAAAAASSSTGARSTTNSNTPKTPKPKPSQRTTTSIAQPNQATVSTTSGATTIAVQPALAPVAMPPSYDELFRTNELTDPFGVPLPPIHHPTNNREM